MSLQVWAYITTKAQERAAKRYPKQYERARKMADSERAINNGPYNLEPLTITQRLLHLFRIERYDRPEHTYDFLWPPPSWRKRLWVTLKFLWTGI